jgi:phosphoenolpyruvate carboxykinase (ATP)
MARLPIGRIAVSATNLNVSLASQGYPEPAALFANLGTAPLIEHAVRNGEGLLAKDGPFVVETGKHTGRSAKDKFIVRDAGTEETVWWGKTNVAMTPEHFAVLKADFIKALGEKDQLYVADLFGGSQSENRVNVRVINELAWHNLFIRRTGRLCARIHDHRLAQLSR